MLSIIADTHTHTLATDHAYSTLTENAAGAAGKGLRFLCHTEHSPSMPGGPSEIHFYNLKSLPRYLSGVMILRGAEVNIMDYRGGLDLPNALMEELEWVIASYHTPNIDPATKEEHTRGWMEIANNPLVDVIGHCGDIRYDFDYRPVIWEFARCGKIVEINAHSFSARPGSPQTCRQIALLCAEYGVPVVVSSDAHFHTHVGRVRKSLEILEEIGFPEELVLNADYDRFLAVAREKSGRLLTDEE